jgi:hypothetical protein
MEIVTGLLAIGLGLVFFRDGLWRWLMIGVGVLGLLPWPGAAAILRRAERDPSILVSDRERRRERGRRSLFVIVPAAITIAALVGYAGGGWSGVATVAPIAGVSAALGGWWAWHWSK